MFEIEKKFFVKRADIPFDLYMYDSTRILQTYLAITDISEVRIRKIFKEPHNNEIVILTYKRKVSENKRVEKEIQIDKQIAGELTEGLPYISKKRYELPHLYKEIELDIFDVPKNLVFAEIEFESEEEMEDFDFPEWFGEETSISNKDIFRRLQEGHHNMDITDPLSL